MATYSRADWGSTISPAGGYAMGPVGEVYIHHFNSGIQPPVDVNAAKARMRSAQAYHASLGWGDIGYSWCVTDQGDAYEGRGWGRSGAHTYGFNSKGYGICWLGDSNVTVPANLALEAIAGIIRTGIARSLITPNPTIVAHRDRVPDTSCCGDVMYAQLPRIRQLVAMAEPAPPPAQFEESEMRACKSNAGTMLLVDGHTYKVLTGDWPRINAGLVEMVRAGLIPGNADGTPTITVLGDNALQLMKERP